MAFFFGGGGQFSLLHSNFKALQVYSETEYHKPYELFGTQSGTIDTREVNN